MKFLVFALIVFLSGCQSFGQRSSAEPALLLTDATNGQLSYSGKGAGAGVMLMGSMGSYGVAIGVAIDVGIGKDIQRVIESNGESWQSQLLHGLVPRLETYCTDMAKSSALCSSSKIELKLHEAGFVTLAGENDPTSAKVNVDLMIDYVLVDHVDSTYTQNSVPLEELKANGKEGMLMLIKALLGALTTYSS